MNPYLICLAVSFGGLFLMAALGVGHHGHHGHVRGVKVYRHHHFRGASRHSSRTLFLLGWFSPRIVFSMLMGFASTGLLVEALLGLPVIVTLAVAFVGGVAFERFLIGPLWTLLFGFASKPAGMLDSVLCGAGEAATDFDGAGSGLVRLELDGQVRQILGTLAAEERSPAAPRIRTGERLFIRSVDGRRNVCTVSRLGC